MTNGTGAASWAAVDLSNTVPYTGAMYGVDLGTKGLTAGDLTVGDVTYPNLDGAPGYYLMTNGTGAASWAAVDLSNTVPYTGAMYGVDLGAYDLTVNGLTVGMGAGSIGSNTANGYQALYSNTTGNGNTANGYRALNVNSTGYNNIALGGSTLSSNTTGGNNTAAGFATLLNNTAGIENTANGANALYYNTIGINNTANGYQSLFSNTTGDGNTANGHKALYSNTTGTSNTAIGNSADVASEDLTNATAIGAGAIVDLSNTIQLGDIAVTNVKTSGTITAGDVIYPNVHGTSGQVLSTSGSGTLSWTTPDSISIGTIGGSSNAKGATVTSGVLSLTPADVTNGGIVTTETQTFAGDKTVNGNFTASKFLSGTTLDKSITTPGWQSGAYTTCWQSFTAGASGFLSKVSMDFKNCAGTGTLSIYRGQGNLGTVLTSQSFSVSTIDNEIFQDFLLNSPVYITNGNEYTIAFVCSSGTINEVVSADFYPGSQYLFYNGSSWPSSPSGGSSILFKTYLSQESGGNITAGGAITAGAVTYPNAHGTSGQVLSTTGSGTLSWVTPSTTATAYSGTLPVENGGTGSATQNFVDLTTDQTVVGAKTFSDNLTVNANESISGNQTVLGTLGVTGTTTVAVLSAGATTLNSLGVSGNGTVGGTLDVTGNETVGGTLGVTGTTTVAVLSAGATTISSLGVSGDETVSGTLGVTGATTVAVLSAGATTLSSNTVSGDETVGGTLGVTGTTTVAVLSAGATTLSSNTVSGNETVGGTLGVTGATTLSSLGVSGNETVDGTLFVTGATTLSSLGVSGNETVDGTLFVTGTSSFGTVNVVNLTVSGTFTNNSDKRLKRNIEPLTNSLQTVMQLNPVSYEKKANLTSTDYLIKENGFIAQDLQKVLPILVNTDKSKDSLLSINYVAIIPILTQAIQEQQKQIEALKAQATENNKLKADMSDLKNQNEQLQASLKELYLLVKTNNTVNVSELSAKK
jgi:hypothetical protein